MSGRAESRVIAYAAAAGRASFIALGFSIPIAVAVDGVLATVVVLAWLGVQRYRETLTAIRDNPVALFACIWFAAHAIAAAYSMGDARDIGRSVSKAAIFLLIPIAIVILEDPRDRERALYAFMAAIALTVVLSCLRWAGAIGPHAVFLKSAATSASVVFKYHLTQNLLVAFGAFVLAVHARRAATRSARLILATLAGIAVVNVVIMGDGRTGQLVLLALVVYYGYWCARGRGVLVAGVLAATLAGAAYLAPQSAMHKRAATGVAEALEWQPGVVAQAPSSIGQRLEYYRRSLDIFTANALVGVGTGGFPASYENEVRGSASPPTRNPHSEYLLKAVELGVPGLALLLGLFWTVWHTAGRLTDPAHAAIARALAITFALASLVTSTFNDHTEALLFIWLAGVLFSGLPRSRHEVDAAAGAGAVAHPR